MAVSGDSAAIKQMLNNMSSEELLKYYDGDSSISASLFNDRTFPFWAFLVLAAFILLFALLRLHAATLTSPSSTCSYALCAREYSSSFSSPPPTRWMSYARRHLSLG